MPDYLMLLSPSANRVYAGAAPKLAAAELNACWPGVNPTLAKIAGIDYLAFNAKPESLPTIARQSACFALFEANGEALLPIELPGVYRLPDDLVTIPKYQGKTNEQFTQLLLNVALAAVTRKADGPRQILDPLAGRGTTLSTALRLGHDAYGVEIDDKAFDAMASFYKTYFRRKRISHSAEITPVRRQGKNIARRFELNVAGLRASVFTGDARGSGELFGKKRFDVVVTDAPYGVAHAAATSGRKDRSPAKLLGETIPIWANQLKRGGALGISWNTFGITRDDLNGIVAKAGLRPLDWDFSHRVDSAIKRDIIVAHKPL